MQSLDVAHKANGKIWHRKPTPSADNGLMVNIHHSQAGSLSQFSRNVRFLHTSFDGQTETFLAGDHQGNVYIFDLNKNRFFLGQKTGHPCTAVAFNLRRKSEFLVGLSDYSLKCFDTDTKEMVAWMKGHESAIRDISVHASGRYALTTSTDTAQLWDLDTFQRKRKLNIKEEVGIVQVFFLPLSNVIITGFKDDTIFAWESDTLKCKYQLPIPPGNSPHYRTFVSTKNGRILAAGGKSRFIHLWDLDTHRVLRIVELPAKVTAVKQMVFLPDNFDAGANQVLGVLSQDGIVRFININTCKLLFDVGSIENKINNITISSSGRHLSAVMEDGSLNVYNLHAMSSELNKPPAPLVKVVSGNKMADTSSKSSLKQKGKGRAGGKENKMLGEGQGTKEIEIPERLNMERLTAILKGYGEYPSKYRMFIWRSVLRLPENHTAYAALVDKGTHPAYVNLQEDYPIKSRKLLRVLQRILSALAHWSPIFGETQYLPVLAFPFVKLFQNNHLVCFEIIATIMENWAEHWFEYFPNPPINILSLIENVLAHHDKYLLQHFVKYGVTSQIYAWPLLETLFSEVLTKDEWLMLWDNVFSNHPSFLLMAVVAYTISARGPLMQCIELDDFKFFYHHRNAVDVRQVIKEAYRLMEATPDDIHPQKTLAEFKPLTVGQYPVFNKYPKFIVDYQVQERERIRHEEMEYLRQRQLSLEMQKETMKRTQEEEAWYRQQQLLMDAEEKRRILIQTEEQKLTAQRKRLYAMNREVKLKELQLLDAARRKFLHFQKEQRQKELRRLDDEVQRKALLRDQETETAIEEAEIRNIELQLQKKMFEQELFREFATASHQLRTEQDMHRKQAELENRIQDRLKAVEKERQMDVRKMLQDNLAQTAQQNIEAWAQNEFEHRHRLEDLERESKAIQLAKKSSENRKLEEEVHNLMKQVQAQTANEADLARLQLGEQKDLAAESDLRRLQFLEEEGYKAHHHGKKLTDDTISTLNSHRPGLAGLDNSSKSELYHTLATSDCDTESKVSIDRDGQAFDEREIALLHEVRRLREKLAVDNRTKKPPPYVVLD